MGTDLSESRRDKCVERHWGDSLLRKSTERDYLEAYDDENIKYQGKSSNRDKSESLRENKDHRSRDKDRKIKDGLKGRGKDLKDSDKDGVSRKRVRKERIEEQGKDKIEDDGREKDLDREKQRRNVYDRNGMDRERKRYLDRDQDHHDTAKEAKSKSRELSIEQTHFSLKKGDVAEDAADLQKSVERARKLALKKPTEKVSMGPVDIAYLATSAVSSQSLDAKNSTSRDASENNGVFTEMDEFVSGLPLDEDTQKPNHEKAWKEKDMTGGWAEVFKSGIVEPSMTEGKEEIVLNNTIREASIGKGLGGTFKQLRNRGELKETIELGGRDTDKKKSRRFGIRADEGTKEIHIERRDEFGRTMTQKEAFCELSHIFHGKRSGKRKQEKRLKQYQNEQRMKQMTSSDVLQQSVERMREAHLQLKSPFLRLS